MEKSKVKYSGAELSLISIDENQYEADDYHAMGIIYNDSRYEDGMMVITSSIECIDFVKGELKVHETLYKLI